MVKKEIYLVNQNEMLSELIKNEVIIYPEVIGSNSWRIYVQRGVKIIKGGKILTDNKQIRMAWSIAVKYEFDRLRELRNANLNKIV
jgi:hypothetical protein